MGAAYDAEAVKKDLEINIVVKIDGDYFSSKQVDIGLIIPDDYICLDQSRVNGVTVDIRNANTAIGTFSFQMQENNDEAIISALIMRDATQFLGKEVTAYVGFITGSFDFSDYIEIAKTNITGVTKIRNGYSITSKEATSLIDNEALNINDKISISILGASSTVDIYDASNWPASGTVKIDDEFIAYTGITLNTLTGLVRGLYGSSAESHALGSEIYLVTIVEEVNPIDFMLQAMLSVDGLLVNDATYDVLPYGLGISPDRIDIAAFETIRDDSFPTEEHTYFIYNNESILKYFEETALLSTNTRIVTVDGKISLTLLDQVNFEDEIPIIDESSIVGVPTWGLTFDKIVNVVEVNYDYNVATGKLETRQVFRDEESITLFGEKKPLKLNFKGVYTSLDGSNIATDRAGRLLARLSTARGKVDFTAHFDSSLYSVGSNVQLIHRYIPQQGGTLGFSDRLEVMGRDIDLEKATVRLRLEFTSYTGIRVAFIAPAVRITVVTDQKTFTVSDASNLKPGYVMRLFADGPLDGFGNPTAGSYLPDGPNVIESIVGNVITMRDAYSSPLVINLWFKFADYDNVIEEQKARYAFVGENSGFFSDGSKIYQIIF